MFFHFSASLNDGIVLPICSGSELEDIINTQLQSLLSATINNKFFNLSRYDKKLSTCQYRYESKYSSKTEFTCNGPNVTNSKSCIFHDKENYAEYEKKATERLEEKVSKSINENKPLECIGYSLSAISFANLLEEECFAQPVLLQ